MSELKEQSYHNILYLNRNIDYDYKVLLEPFYLRPLEQGLLVLALTLSDT